MMMSKRTADDRDDDYTSSSDGEEEKRHRSQRRVVPQQQQRVPQYINSGISVSSGFVPPKLHGAGAIPPSLVTTTMAGVYDDGTEGEIVTTSSFRKKQQYQQQQQQHHKKERNAREREREKETTMDEQQLQRRGVHDMSLSKQFAFMNLSQDTGKEHRRCIKKHLIIDSRDRDIAAYPSANRFDSFLGDRLKGAKSLELISIIVPIPPGFVDRYVVLAEDHCDDGMLFADRVPFGFNTTTPGVFYKTGCSFPKGSMAMIQMAANSFGGTAVTWSSNNVGSGWKTKFRDDMNNIDRLSFSLWTWNNTAVPLRYPLPNELPPPVVPDVNNNVMMTFRIHYH